MKAVTADQIRNLDRRAIKSGVSGRELMEATGRVVGWISDQVLARSYHDGNTAHFRVLVLAYKGYNGGDAFVATRELFGIRYNDEICLALFCKVSDLKGDSLLELATASIRTAEA